MNLSYEDKKRLFAIAEEMEQRGVPASFMGRVVERAESRRGTFGLLELWLEADVEQKNEILADLQEQLDGEEELRRLKNEAGPVKLPRISFNRLDEIAKDVRAFKEELRNKIEQRMSLAELARRLGMPDSSISRFFSSGSMPRKTTLYRIAVAADLREEDISARWVKA